MRSEFKYNCKIGKVKPKNLHVLEDPLAKWSSTAFKSAHQFLKDSENDEEVSGADVIVVYVHHSNGFHGTHVHFSELSSFPTDLIGEMLKRKVNECLERDRTREAIYEVLES